MATTNTSTALSTALQLAYARTVVVRDIDMSLAGHHGLGLNDVALLLELHGADGDEHDAGCLQVRAGRAGGHGPLEDRADCDEDEAGADAHLVPPFRFGPGSTEPVPASACPKRPEI